MCIDPNYFYVYWKMLFFMPSSLTLEVVMMPSLGFHGY